MKIPGCNTLLILLFGNLLIGETIRFIAKICAEHAMLAITTVIEKCAVTALPAVEGEKDLKTFMGIDEVHTSLTLKRIRAVLCRTYRIDAIAVAKVFGQNSGMAEMAVLAVPPVIGVLAILVPRTHVVCDGTATEELPHLRKERLAKIDLGRRRIGVLDPLVLVPHGIGAILRKDGDDLLARLIACALVERPVLPEGAEDLPAYDGTYVRLAFDTQFLAQCHLGGRNFEGTTGDGASLLHTLILARNEGHVVRIMYWNMGLVLLPIPLNTPLSGSTPRNTRFPPFLEHKLFQSVSRISYTSGSRACVGYAASCGGGDARRGGSAEREGGESDRTRVPSSRS